MLSYECAKKGRPNCSKVAAACCGGGSGVVGRFRVGVMVRSQDGRRHHDNTQQTQERLRRRYRWGTGDDDVVGNSFIVSSLNKRIIVNGEGG